MVETMTQNPPDEALVRKAQQGDADAFPELVKLYERRVQALAASRLSPALRRKLGVDDVVQETLTRAFDSLDRFQWQGESSFLRWLGTITRNVIARAARDEKVSPDLEIVQPVAAADVSPSRLARRDERFDRLEDALGKLIPEQREAIRLSRIDGLKIRDVAASMGRSPEAVQQLIVRGLRSLRRNFGDTESLHLPDRAFDVDHAEGEKGGKSG